MLETRLTARSEVMDYEDFPIDPNAEMTPENTLSVSSPVINSLAPMITAPAPLKLPMVSLCSPRSKVAPAATSTDPLSASRLD